MLDELLGNWRSNLKPKNVNHRDNRNVLRKYGYQSGNQVATFTSGGVKQKWTPRFRERSQEQHPVFCCVQENFVKRVSLLFASEIIV